jgi:DNA-binding NarL/FixJ family response regulator
VSEALQAKPDGSIDRASDRPIVALVGLRSSLAELDPALEGFEVMSFEAVEELPEAAKTPSLIALWVGDDLPKTVAGDLILLRRSLAGAPVILVCSEIRPGDLRVALSSGACGVVLEDELVTALGPALWAAGAGQVCVPQQHSQQVEPASLTPREKQILGLVVMGYMNSQIAEQLFVAESTVKSHLSSAFAKLGVRSRTEAAELIMDSERGLGMGILTLGGEPLEAIPNGDVAMAHGG